MSPTYPTTYIIRAPGGEVLAEFTHRDGDVALKQARAFLSRLPAVTGGTGRPVILRARR